jgi:hypothetical protein
LNNNSRSGPLEKNKRDLHAESACVTQCQKVRTVETKNQELTLSTKPVILHDESAAMLSHDQTGGPRQGPLSLFSHLAGILKYKKKQKHVIDSSV